jgi:hypothetical protein
MCEKRRLRWEHVIQMNLKEVGCQDREQWWNLMNTVMSLPVPQKAATDTLNQLSDC